MLLSRGLATGACGPRHTGRSASPVVSNLSRRHEQVITLDASMRPTGAMGKLEAHQGAGHLHLAFSVLLRAHDGRVLLQRRAEGKHHFAGDWANTCCSHPRPGETIRAAATRRLGEELGLADAPELTPWAAFTYEARDERSGLIEVEYDVVLTGTMAVDHPLDPAPREVAELAWMDGAAVEALLHDDTQRVAPWLVPVLEAAAGTRGPVAATVAL